MNSSINCEKSLEQFQFGICWFMAILHALFFSEKTRKHIEPYVKNLENTTDIASFLKSVFDYPTKQGEQPYGVCMKALDFLTYMRFQYGNTIYSQKQVSLYNKIDKVVDDCKAKIGRKYETTLIDYEGEMIELIPLDNYIVRCNPITNFMVNKSVGGVPQNFILPFVYCFLKQENVLQYNISYNDFSSDNELKRIDKQTEFDDIIKCIMSSIPSKSNSPDMLLISCGLGNEVKINTQLSKTVNSTQYKYTLQSAIFGVKINNDQGHAIAGVRCGGKSYLMDSFVGTTYEFDWLNDREVALGKYIEEFAKKYRDDVPNAVITYGDDVGIMDVYIYVRDTQTQAGGKKHTPSKLKAFLQKSLYNKKKRVSKQQKSKDTRRKQRTIVSQRTIKPKTKKL